MTNKLIKKCRFNYVMTEQEKQELKELQLFQNKLQGYGGTTVASIIRRLVSDEVKRVRSLK